MATTMQREVVVIKDEEELAGLLQGSVPRSSHKMCSFGRIELFDVGTVPLLFARLDPGLQPAVPMEWNTLLCEIPVQGKTVFVRLVSAQEAADLIEQRNDLYDRMWNGCGCCKPNYTLW